MEQLKAQQKKRKFCLRNAYIRDKEWQVLIQANV